MHQVQVQLSTAADQACTPSRITGGGPGPAGVCNELNLWSCLAQEDVECDFGYHRVNSTCVAMPGIRAAECPALQGNQYRMSATHLRQIHEDVCTDLARVSTLP